MTLRGKLAGLVAIVAMAMPMRADAVQAVPRGFQPPNTGNAELLSESHGRFRGVECTVRNYQVREAHGEYEEGQRFNFGSVRATGIQFLLTVQRDGANRFYIDEDCNGVFDRSYGPNEGAPVPSCALGR